MLRRRTQLHHCAIEPISSIVLPLQLQAQHVVAPLRLHALFHAAAPLGDGRLCPAQSRRQALLPSLIICHFLIVAYCSSFHSRWACSAFCNRQVSQNFTADRLAQHSATGRSLRISRPAGLLSILQPAGLSAICGPQACSAFCDRQVSQHFLDGRLAPHSVTGRSLSILRPAGPLSILRLTSHSASRPTGLLTQLCTFSCSLSSSDLAICDLFTTSN